MSNPSKKTLEKYWTMVKNTKHVWEKSEIHALGKLLNRGNYSPNEEISKLAEYVQTEMKPMRITQEQTEFGLAWLKERLYKSNGELRNSKIADTLGALIKPLNKFKEFRFVGFNTFTNYGGYVNYVAPIYEVISKDGYSIPYAHVHWGETYVGSYAIIQDYHQPKQKVVPTEPTPIKPVLSLIQGGNEVA